VNSQCQANSKRKTM